MKSHKTLLLAGKIAIAAGLLAWVLSRVHWHDYVVHRSSGNTYAVLGKSARGLEVARGVLWWRTTEVRPADEFQPVKGARRVVRLGFASSVKGVRPIYLAGATLSFLCALVTVAVRWWLLLRVQGIRIRLWEAIRLMFLGQFFNAVVPGTVGGDLVKAYYVSRHTTRKTAALVSILVDRMTGLSQLLLLGVVMICVIWLGGWGQTQWLARPAIILAVLVAGLLLAGLFIFSRRFRRALRIEKFYRRLPISPQIAAAGKAADIYRRRMGSLAAIGAGTIVSHTAWVGAVMLVGMGLSMPLPWYHFYVYVPLIYIIGAVPLTPGGVGLIEKFYVVFFASGQVTPSMVLALALLARLIPMFLGLPGLVVAVTGPKVPDADTMRAELLAGRQGG